MGAGGHFTKSPSDRVTVSLFCVPAAVVGGQERAEGLNNKLTQLGGEGRPYRLLNQAHTPANSDQKAVREGRFVGDLE